MKKTTILIAFFLAFISVSFGQTVLINPATGGGFESGTTFTANGWSVSNGANNAWVVGTAAATGAMTGNLAYVSSNGTGYTYNNTTPASNFFWRDVTIPAGETVIKLTFNWVNDGEDSWDIWQVFYAPTTVTPVGSTTHPGSGTTNVPAGITGATFLGFGQDSPGVQTATFSLPAALAGTTVRIIFGWKSDTSDGVNPPAAIDNISMTSRAPGNFVSIASGNYGSASTWDANAVPEAADSVTISAGHTVTINAASQAANNVLVNGTLDFGATPTSFAIGGNLTVNAAGAVNVFNATTGKTLNVAGHLTNDGSINVSVGATTAGVLNFNGTAPQTIGGTGTFVNNIIRNLTFNNTSTTFPNITWNVNNVSVEYNLTITNAKIALGTNKLTYGTSATTTGNTFSFTNGGFIGGKFARWWSASDTGYTTSGPSSVATGAAGRYPFYTPDGTQQRIFYLGRTTPSAGGVYAVAYTNSSAFTTGLSIADGAYTITNRWNGNFVVTTEGTTPDAASNWVTIFTPSLYYPLNGNSRVMGQAAALSGTHVATGGGLAAAQRSGVSTADVTAATGVTIGIAQTDLNFTAVASGNWNAPATWNTGTVPTCTDNIVIGAGINVTVNSAANVARNITIMAGGTLTVASGDLTAGCTLNNNVFTNNGTLTVTGGTLNINGNLLSTAGSTFNQSGGDINVDGNAAGVAANSVASGTAIVQLNSQFINWTGGTLTVVDPHANSTSSYSFTYNNSTAHANAGAAHTLRFGNGVSTDAGGSATYGFRMNTFPGSNRMIFGNLTVDGGSGTNRFVSSDWGIGVLGNLTITTGSAYRDSGITTYVAGNIVNNGNYLNTGTLYIGSFFNGTAAPGTNAQTISGTGTFANNATTPTASLSTFTINNTNATGVTLSVPLSVSGTLNLTAGKVNTSSTSVLSLGTATTTGTLNGGGATAYIAGPFARTIASGSANTTYIPFPVGKAAYAPIFLAPATTAVSVMRAEAFDTNTGTMDPSIIALSTTRRWEAPLVSGTITSINVRLGSTGIVSTNIPVMAPAAAGLYTNSFGSVATFAAGTPNTTQSNTSATAAAYTGFLSFADSNVCSGTPAPGNTIASANNICSGTSVTLSVQNSTAGTGVTYQWQSSSDGVAYADIATATAATYTTTPTEALYYRLNVTCATGPATGASTPVQVNFANSVTATTPGARCGTGTVSLAAVPSAGATIKWFAAATGGTAIGTGSPFVTPSISANTIYYAAAQTTSAGTGVIGTGTTLTGATEQPTAFCNRWPNYTMQIIYTAADLTAAGLMPGNITSMAFNIATLGDGANNANFRVRLGNVAGTTFANTTFLTTGFTTVYGPATYTHTASGWQTITFTTPFPWDGTSNIVVEVKHDGADSINNSQTYYTATPGTVLWINSNTSPVTGTISPNRLNVTFGGQVACNSARVPVVATVNPPPAFALSTGTGTICNGQSTPPVTITTGATDYDTFVWAPATGVSGTAGTGWTFNPTTTTTYTLTATNSVSGCGTTAGMVVTVNPIPVITTDVADALVCEGGTQALTFGASLSGTAVSGVATTASTAQTTAVALGPNPLQNFYGGTKQQWIYTATELTSMGFVAGSQITAISLDLATANNALALQNLSIKMKNTTQGAFATTTSWIADMITVRPAANYSPVAGLNNFVLGTPFTWDGTSNLAVQMSYSNNTSPSEGTNSARFSPTAFVSTIFYRVDLNTPAAVESFTGTATSTFSTRNNVTFTFNTPVPVTWAPATNLYTDAAATIPYTGTNLGTVYTKPTAAISYTATGTTGLGCTISSTADITINVVPAPTAAATQTFCNSATVANLVATGTAVKWYVSPVGGTQLAGTVGLANGMVYYASQTVAGCESVARTAVTAVVNITPAPTASEDVQTFCNTATIADLEATGTGVLWYEGPTGGTALATTDAIEEGVSIYYASQTIAGCESSVRTAVAVLVNMTEAPLADDTQTFCNAATVADLMADGDGILWYADEMGGTAMADADELEDGIIYYASQTVDGCESATRTGVTVVINSTAEPTVDNATQAFCNSATVADLMANGDNIMWYMDETGGTAMADTDMLADGEIYYASQTMNGCESLTRVAVTVAITVTAEPEADTTQHFCNAATVADLTATGDNIQWYTTAMGGTALTPETALADGIYYASQTVDGCESGTRAIVAVEITIAPTVTGNANQAFEVTDPSEATIEDIVVDVVDGGTIIWYATEEDALAGTNALAAGTQLETGVTYYAMQVVGECSSPAAFGVTVEVTLDNREFNTTEFTYYPNPVKDMLTLSYSENITNVIVYNMIGQPVINKQLNAVEGRIDMSNLADGPYMVQVTAGSAVKTVRVIKKQ